MQNKWDEFFIKNGRFYLLTHPDIYKFINILKQKNQFNVLDIGCGTGRHLIAMAENDLIVTGIDFSPSAGHIAESWLKEKNLTGKVYIGNYKKELKNIPENSFEAILAINSLQYSEDKEELHEIFFEIARITVCDACIMIVFPSKETVIIEPNIERIFLTDKEIQEILSKYLLIDEIYQDEYKAWVIICRNKKQNTTIISES